MKKVEVDIEKLLKDFGSEPGKNVRQSVMSEFDRKTGSADKGGVFTRFWGRPVPAYVVIAMMLIFITGAFFAGRRLAGPRQLPVAGDQTSPGQEKVTSEEIPWSTTAVDLL
jgi:hypothetical protein